MLFFKKYTLNVLEWLPVQRGEKKSSMGNKRKQVNKKLEQGKQESKPKINNQNHKRRKLEGKQIQVKNCFIYSEVA